jgi:anaerobic ribonucleoside-triphosphate reductase
VFPKVFKPLLPNVIFSFGTWVILAVGHRVRGVKILKAVSSPLRLQILNLLFDKGPLSYTELMSSLKMNPSRDAGRFAYHLKFLLKADLIEAIVESKKYSLTDLGKMVLDVAERIEKKAFRPRTMLVRTSRSALEEFDSNKIADSLIKEAKMPAEQAQKVAKEAERQLFKSKTKYLTAPLVREVVNAILIDKGFEEYRHKLTRLGVPVHDVTSLVETKDRRFHESLSIHEAAGSTVLKEYILLNVFPRDIADAHLSGLLHINDLSSWILKPTEIMHDIRFFLQRGLNLEKISSLQPSHSPPKSFEAALSLLFNVLLHSVKEVGIAQNLDYFNVFLAPLIDRIDPQEVKDSLRLFLENVGQYANASISLELTLPDFIAEKPFIDSSGKTIGNYADFREEVQTLALLILEILAEESARKPMFNPRVIVKMRQETFIDEEAKPLLLNAHGLAADKGIPLFAGLLREKQKYSVFSFSGCKLNQDFSQDWEIDTMRTGCLGVVTINLPRVAYESGKDQTRFFESLRERIEMANRALEIKYRAIRQYGKGLLPFIMSNGDGDRYFRLENASRIISLGGLKEAAQAFSEKETLDAGALEFARQIAETTARFVHRLGGRRGKRLFPALLPCPEASGRLAKLDIERFGIARVKFSGTRDRPFYSTTSRVALQKTGISQDNLVFESKLGEARAGGELAVIELGETEFGPDELMNTTKHLTEIGAFGLFTYNRKSTYCLNCRRSWFGSLHKCPGCGATSTLALFDRFAGT